MKIIKRIDNALVVFAEKELSLSIDGARGSEWWAPDVKSSEHIIETVESLPEGFIPGKWIYTAGTWSRTLNEETRRLEIAKEIKIKELSVAHDNAIYDDIIYNNTTFKADQYSQDLLVKVLAVGSVPPNMYWRDKKGAQKTMGIVDLKGLASKILERALIADGNLIAKTAAANNAKTIAEVSAITW